MASISGNVLVGETEISRADGVERRGLSMEDAGKLVGICLSRSAYAQSKDKVNGQRSSIWANSGLPQELGSMSVHASVRRQQKRSGPRRVADYASFGLPQAPSLGGLMPFINLGERNDRGEGEQGYSPTDRHGNA